ncbi:AMP-binding protein [Rhizorhabdus argentea]|uniref:AMP-binding protein n=1 Tax=Rhizorhabdus argentea TaxID=1387174 RepID=UPI0030EC3583
MTGSTADPLLEITIGDALRDAAQRWPDADAVIVPYQDITWTWSELDRHATRVAANLIASGLEQGDRIGIWSPNRAEWILVQFAAARAGLILVTINPAYRTGELVHTINTVGMRAIVASTCFKSSNYKAMLIEAAPELASASAGRLRRSPASPLSLAILLGDPDDPRFACFDDFCAAPPDDAIAKMEQIAGRLGRFDPVNIQFTSGTTGLPKGAILSHRNILNNGRNLGRALRLSPTDRLCLPVPLYHCFGMVMGVLACVTHGAAIVLPGEGFDPRVVLQVLAATRCTVLYGVPTMFIAELAELAELGRPLPHISVLRAGVMAGALCPVELMRAARERLGIEDFIICYGMTETSPVSFQTAHEDPADLQVSTVGRVQPHLESKIVDDQGSTVPMGVRGELCTRGYSVMLGYWGDAEQTAMAIDRDGWMHSGDVATFDDKGYCRITGRLKDMIIRGGENIYPAEVEAHLRTHEHVDDVQVIGIPDERFGEIVCACIITVPGTDLDEKAVLDHCRGKIAHFKVPGLVRFMDIFPMTVTGKVKKFALRDIVTAALAAER